ncbi:MAG: S9 family peptidase, partial [Dokdonella sp.]
MRLLPVAVAFACFACAAVAADKPFDVETLANLDRLSGQKLSPDGSTLVWQLRQTDYAANKGRNSIWTMPVAGGAPQRWTANDLNANSPAWSADGGSVYFLAAKDGVSQLWQQTRGGKAQPVTNFPLDVDSYKLSPDGRHLLGSMSVFTDCADLACTKQKLDAKAKDKATGMLYDRLFVRHWDTWSDGRRNQLFVADLGTNGRFGAARLLTRGIDGDVPSKPFGDDSEYAFSPDGNTVYFNARIAGKTEAWSTNFDVYSVPVDGSAAPKNLTAANLAWDGNPLPSTDGKTLY